MPVQVRVRSVEGRLRTNSELGEVQVETGGRGLLLLLIHPAIRLLGILLLVIVVLCVILIPILSQLKGLRLQLRGLSPQANVVILRAQVISKGE